MIRSLRRLTRLFMLAFVLIAAGVGFWGLISQGSLVTRQDNPRTVLAEQQIRQGDIFDRDGRVLVTSMPATGQPKALVRDTLYPEVAPVTGFYSLRHGTGGITSAFETTLHGERFLTPLQSWLNALLHHPQTGGDVQVTISLPIQQAVRTALEGQRGAIVIVDAVNGDILAMDSLPTYDPNTLDEEWDQLRADPAAPLLNRATQALYQPGGVLQSILIGEAINTGTAKPSDNWDGILAAQFANGTLPCAAEPGTSIQTLGDAFTWGCPGPFQSLGADAGITELRREFSDFGLADAPIFELPVSVSTAPSGESDTSASNAAIGQGSLTVTPLHMALVAASFANHGQMPVPRLVSAIRPPGQDWTQTLTQATPRGTISGTSIEAVKTLMRQAVISGAAHAASQPPRAIYGHTGLALAGPDRTFNTWFIGFVYSETENPIAIAVLLEDTRDASAASRIGGMLLAEAMTLLEK